MTKVLVYPSKELRVVTKEIKKVDKELKVKMEKLKETLIGCGNGVGLAATQLGFNERMFAMKDVGEKKVNVLINPEIVKVWGEKEFPKVMAGEEEFLEGCLSFPNLFGTVKRYLRIEARWMGGGKILEGFEAIVFQHELDHLNGILLIDRIKESLGKIYRIEGEKKVEIELPDY